MIGLQFLSYFLIFRKKKGDYPGLDLSDKAPISQVLAKHDKIARGGGILIFRIYRRGP
jgi:hypothetical protein